MDERHQHLISQNLQFIVSLLWAFLCYRKTIRFPCYFCIEFKCKIRSISRDCALKCVRESRIVDNRKQFRFAASKVRKIFDHILNLFSPKFKFSISFCLSVFFCTRTNLKRIRNKFAYFHVTRQISRRHIQRFEVIIRICRALTAAIKFALKNFESKLCEIVDRSKCVWLRILKCR